MDTLDFITRSMLIDTLRAIQNRLEIDFDMRTTDNLGDSMETIIAILENKEEKIQI